MWDIEAGDRAMPGADRTAQQAPAQVAVGSVIRLHDAGGDRPRSVGARSAVIEGLLGRGLDLVSVPELSA